MLVNILEFLKSADIKEVFYPGKRLVKACKQVGEFKSHCAVLDWRNPGKIRLDIKPGLTGKAPVPADLKKYPVSFQTPTYVEIDVVHERKDEDEEEGEGEGKSSGSGGGKSFKKSGGLQNVEMIAGRFGTSVEGRIPDSGQITAMVVMGMHIAKEAFESVFETLTKQIAHAKISATELLAHAGKFVTRVAPPSFLAPKGDETVKYHYDTERNANIGYIPTLH